MQNTAVSKHSANGGAHNEKDACRQRQIEILVTFAMKVSCISSLAHTLPTVAHYT